MANPQQGEPVFTSETLEVRPIDFADARRQGFSADECDWHTRYIKTVFDNERVPLFRRCSADTLHLHDHAAAKLDGKQHTGSNFHFDWRIVLLNEVRRKELETSRGTLRGTCVHDAM